MMIYNIGQILTLKNDVELKGALTGNTKIKKAGTKLFVTASENPHMATYLDGGLHILPEDSELKGYSVEGITEFIYIWLQNRFEINYALDDYGIEVSDFTDEIMNALEELGMYDHTGNRS